jgi:hypothetical protein
MTDTIIDMRLRYADTLFPNQLMEQDLIKVNDEYFTIKSLTQNSEGFNLIVLNDFDEQAEIFLFDDEQVELYVFVE